MSTKTFHWRDISQSRPLQLLLGILKDAPGPMTQMEIQLEAQRMGAWVANPSTSIGEIGENPGHETSGAVLFPDGQYRYWLLRAPGWRARWVLQGQYRPGKKKVLASYKIVAAGSIQPPAAEAVSGTGDGEERKKDQEPAIECMGCGKPIKDKKSLWHDDDCKALWRRNNGIPDDKPADREMPAQGSLL